MVADQAQPAPVNADHDDDVLSHIKTIDGKITMFRTMVQLKELCS